MLNPFNASLCTGLSDRRPTVDMFLNVACGTRQIWLCVNHDYWHMKIFKTV